MLREEAGKPFPVEQDPSRPSACALWPQRRVLLKLGLGIGSLLLLSGHSPYRQWYAYRAKHLIIVATEQDPGASAIAEAIARNIAVRAPNSGAVAAATRTALEAVKLVHTHQLPVALLTEQDARDAWRGRGAFRDEGPVPLRLLAVFPPFVLVSLEDFPPQRARQLAQVLIDHPPDRPVPRRASPDKGGLIPVHPAVAGLQSTGPNIRSQ
jgi:hypothetical protein